MRNTTLRSQSNHKCYNRLLQEINGQQHRSQPKKRRHHNDVGGITPTWTTATERHDKQDCRMDLHPEAYRSNIEKHDYTNANIWWWKFVQNKKTTKDLNLTIMTNIKEKLPQYRDQKQK